MEELLSELRATLGKMQAALDSILESIFWTDAAGVIQWCNVPFGDLVARPRLGVLGQRLFDLLPLSRAGRVLAWDEHPCRLVLETGTPVEGSYDFSRGEEKRTLDVHGVCLAGEGKGTSGVFVIRDITELQTMQKHLIQAEKLSALGRFSLGLAHEVKNPLAIILGGIEYLEKKKLGNRHAEIPTVLEDMKEASYRADGVVKSLLKFAQPSPLNLEKASPQELALKMTGLLRYRASLQNIEMEVRIEQGDLVVEMDRNQIEQVLFNLLLNAVEAMAEGGRLTVRIYPEGRFCVLEVADEGPGIPPENLARIFEPFFTTKRGQKGTGLGLSISRMIVENHRGRLWIESEPGRGATARIALPLSEGQTS